LLQKETKYLEVIEQQGSRNKLIDSVMNFMDARAECMNINLAAQSLRIDEHKAGAGTLLYDTVVEDASCFKYEVMPHSCRSTGDGLIDLQVHDTGVVTQVNSKVQKKAARLNFIIKKDAIAISSKNHLFAEFTLQLISRSIGEDCQMTSLYSGIVQFQFANSSHKISAVKDIITIDHLSSVSASSNKVNFATYPSVVSVDHPCST